MDPREEHLATTRIDVRAPPIRPGGGTRQTVPAPRETLVRRRVLGAARRRYVAARVLEAGPPTHGSLSSQPRARPSECRDHGRHGARGEVVPRRSSEDSRQSRDPLTIALVGRRVADPGVSTLLSFGDDASARRRVKDLPRLPRRRQRTLWNRGRQRPGSEPTRACQRTPLGSGQPRRISQRVDTPRPTRGGGSFLAVRATGGTLHTDSRWPA